MNIKNTSNTIGKEIGLVTGECVTTRNFARDFINNVRNFFGFELKTYTQMLGIAKDEAIKRMIKDAESLNATEIINVRFAITSLTNDAMVVLVSGTATK